MTINPESIARASSRHPWRVIGAWVVVFIVMGSLSGVLLGDVLNNDIAFTNKPESIQAQDIVDRQFSAKQAGVSTEYIIVQSSSLTVADPEFQAYVTKLQGAVAAKTGILAAPPATYYDVLKQDPDQAAGLVSADKSATLIPVTISDDATTTIDELRSVIAQNSQDGFTTQLAGEATLNADFSKIAEEDARKGEGIGLAVAFIVLIIVFAAILASLVPLGTAVMAIVIALGLVSVVGQLVSFNLFVTNIITMIGLAVGIDYSLFIVSRFREERKKGFDVQDAVGAAGATANRAVFFSGMTVVLALLGMFIIPTTIFRALAAGAIFVTLVSIAASMTLLPAALTKLGDRVNWPYLSRLANVGVLVAMLIVGGVVGGVLGAVGVPVPLAMLAAFAAVIGFAILLTKRIRQGTSSLLKRVARPDGIEYDHRGGFWDRLTRRVMARPAIFLIAGVLVLGGLGAFYFQMNKGSSTNINQLPDVPSKAAAQTLAAEFGGNRTDPVLIVVSGDVNSSTAQAGIQKLQGEIAQDPSFDPRSQVTVAKNGSAAQISALLKGENTQNGASFAAIKDLRTQAVPQAFGGVPGVQVYVGGNSAIFYDFLHVTDTYQWIVLAFVLGLSFMLLTVVFRSIVVPVKAIIMNLLSVAAAYGAVTLVFQKGVGIGFFNAIGFNFHQSDAIEAWLPLFLFSILFGLSMDYHVFLLSRIREEYDKTHDNTEAVAYGLRTTAGIITGAAVIMVVVFIAFALGRLGPLQQMGFGLAVAVLMDATIVRILLVPSAMRLLGDRNWYLPKWLEWLPKVNVEGHEPELTVNVPDSPAELVEAGEKE